METDMSSIEAQAVKCYNFFVSLFDNGEFNEIVVTKGQDGYSLKMDNDTYLGTLTQNSDRSWNLVNGRIPAYLVSQITRNMDKKLKN